MREVGSLLFDRVRLKVCTVLYQMRVGKSTQCSTWPRLDISTLLYAVGKSRVFDRDLTKSMHCIVPSQSREVESFRRRLNRSIPCIVASDNREVDGARRGSD